MKNDDLIFYLELDDKIEELNLSKRTYHALYIANVKTIGDLVKLLNENRLERIRNIGSTALEEIKQSLKQKCNITKSKCELEEKLNLSTSAINKLINRFNITTLDELLEISLNKKYSFHLDPNIKIDKEIIDKVHALGLKFKDEEEKNITLKDNVRCLNISNSYFNRLNLTLEELLKLPLKSILRIRGIGPKNAKEIIDKVHALGFKFDFETQEKTKKAEEPKEEPVKKITSQDSIYKLGYHHVLTMRMLDYGINTIEDLLNLSLNPNTPRDKKSIYKIRGFGEYRVKELIEYVHSLGFKFKEERIIGKFIAIAFNDKKYEFIINDDLSIDCPTIGLKGFKKMIIKPRFELLGGPNNYNYISNVSRNTSNELIREYQIDDELLNLLSNNDIIRYSTDMAYFYGFKNKKGYDTKMGYKTNGKPFKWASKKGEILVKQRNGIFN